MFFAWCEQFHMAAVAFPLSLTLAYAGMLLVCLGMQRHLKQRTGTLASCQHSLRRSAVYLQRYLTG